MEAVLAEFDAHASRLKQRSRAAREQALLTSTALQDEEPEAAEESLFTPLATDSYAGDAHLRALRALLKRVDKTHERSDNQLKFHSAFERACSRVLFGEAWSTSKPQIMQKYGWESCPSEVMVSTPALHTQIPKIRSHTRLERR